MNCAKWHNSVFPGFKLVLIWRVCQSKSHLILIAIYCSIVRGVMCVPASNAGKATGFSLTPSHWNVDLWPQTDRSQNLRYHRGGKCTRHLQVHKVIVLIITFVIEILYIYVLLHTCFVFVVVLLIKPLFLIQSFF